MSYQPELSPNYSVLVAGAGAVYEEKVANALDRLGPAEKRYIFDISPDRISEVTRGRGFVADVLDAPLARNRIAFSQDEAVVSQVVKMLRGEKPDNLLNPKIWPGKIKFE